MKVRKRTNRAGIVLIIVFFVVILASAVYYFKFIDNTKPGQTARNDYYEPYGQITEESVIIKLFYASKDSRMQYEEREIPKMSDSLSRTKAIVEELLKGPKNVNLVSVIPVNTRLKNIFIEKGAAYLDFSNEITAGHCGGTDGELLTVASLFKTLSSNVSGIKAIQIIVDGNEIETLKGHLDAGKPIQRYMMEF